MSQSPGSIYDIRWREVFPWLVLAKALRASIFLRVMVIAWIGVLVTQGGWILIDSVFSEPIKLERIVFSDSPQEYLARIPGTGVPMEGDRLFRAVPAERANPRESEAAASWVWHHFLQHKKGPLVESWLWLSDPFVRIFRLETTFAESCQLLLCGAWAICVWALAGGAISRIAARYLTRGDVIDPFAAIKSSASKWIATAGAPLIGLLFAGSLAFPLALMGLLLRLNLFTLIAGFLWGLYLMWGILLAVVLVALWLGWPLAWATIGVERSDAFDAASRAAAYVYQRPLRFIFYVAVASLLGMFGHLVVAGFATAGDELTDWATSWGAGSERTAALVAQPLAGDNPLESSGAAIVGARAIHFWKGLLVSFVDSYPLAFLWCATTGIYLLQRHHVDTTELDEIVGEPGEDLRSPHLPLPTGKPEAEELSTRRV